MPGPMTATVTSPSAQPRSNSPQAPARLVPFNRASSEVVQPTTTDRSNLIGTNPVLLGPDDVPAFGYLRHVNVLVQATGGTGAAAVYKADAPWSAIQELTFQDINGANIVQVTGYQLYLLNKYGGYNYAPDPTQSPAYVAPATNGNFSFLVRVPLEISQRDALGALANSNASATYKLRIVQAAQTDVYSTAPTTFPTVRVRAWAELWAPVPPVDNFGQPNAVTPPAEGTTQFWSRYQPTIAAGNNTVQLRRVGGLVRNLILVHRDASSVRADANLPDPFQFFIDSRILFNEALVLRRHRMYERFGVQADAGVLVLDFAHDFTGHGGYELRDGYLETVQSTRLEIVGTFAAAGSLEVLTNDVQPQGNIFVD